MDGSAQIVCEVPCAPGGRLHISWGLGNELYTLDLQSSPSHESTASCVQWGRLTPCQRRIAYDSLPQYEQLQQREADPRSPEGWEAAGAYCRTVGQVLAPQPIRVADTLGDEAVALQERAVWDLLALFFLDAQQAQQGLVAQDLARWLRANALAACGCCAAAHPLPPSLVDELREAALPEAHAGYWACLQRLVCLGWVPEAVDLLGLHSAWLRWEGGLPGGGAAPTTDPDTAAQVAALEAVTLLLRRTPAMQHTAGAGQGGGAVAATGGREFSSLEEFMAYRRGWQGECAAVLRDAPLWQACAAAAPETAEGLRGALAVLSGDEAGIAAAARGWVELLVGQLLHIYPSVKPQAELKQLVHRCYAAAGEGGGGEDFTHLLAVLLEGCCDGDAQTVMRACSAYPCSDWFMAHAPPLMAAHPAGGVLGRELPHLGGDQVEFYTLDYAAALMPQHTTWQVAAAYLAWCPAHGRPALEALLGALPLDAGDPSVAQQALAVCRRHGLHRLAERIQVRQGVLCWQSGMLGAALTWLARAGDDRRIDTALAPLAATLTPLASTSAPALTVGDPEQQQQQVPAQVQGQSKGQQAQREAERVLGTLWPALHDAPPGSANLALLRVHRLLRRAAAAAAPVAAQHGAGGKLQERGALGDEEGEWDVQGSCGSGGAGRVGAVVSELRHLPQALRDGCLPLVCAALGALPPGQLGEADVMQLLAWLQGAEARLLPPPAGEPGAAGAAQQAAAGTARQRQLAQVVGLARLALCRSLAAGQMVAGQNLKAGMA